MRDPTRMRTRSKGLGSTESTSATTTKKRARRSSETNALVVDEDEVKQLEQKKKERTLPDELWVQILQDVHDDSVAAFACVSKQLRRVQLRSGRRLRTNLIWYDNTDTLAVERGLAERVKTVFKAIDTKSEGWCLWAMSLATSTEEEKIVRRRITNAAAQHGHLNVLKHWKKEIAFDEHTCAAAALGGCLKVLLWLRANNCPWNEGTSYNAAEGGHLEVMKYAHEHGCPWNKWTCSSAAQGGHLDVLKYAHENGCPCTCRVQLEEVT